MPEEHSKQDEQEKRIKDLHVHIPWRLAGRIKSYAAENNNTVTNVVIEALDAFLRGREG